MRFNSAVIGIKNLNFVHKPKYDHNSLSLVMGRNEIGAAVFNWLLIRKSFEVSLLELLKVKDFNNGILGKIFKLESEGN